MDDKEKIHELYEKMNRIAVAFESLNSNVSLIKEDLTKSFLIDNNCICNEEVIHCINKVNEVNDSVKYDVMNHLKDYI